MAAHIEYVNEIDRPLAKVFHFFADEHVNNHPRWDPDMELEQLSDGPIGVGTVIKRRNSRYGTPVEGTMEIVEFDRDRTMGTVIHDGDMEIRARVLFEALADDRTRMTTLIELPAKDESMDKSFLLGKLERSAKIQRELMESEIPPGDG